MQLKKSQPFNLNRNRSGSILIVLLFILVLLSGLGLNLAHYANRDRKLTIYYKEKLKARHIARIALGDILEKIENDAHLNNSDYRQEPWITSFYKKKKPALLTVSDQDQNVIGHYSVSIQDEGSKLDILGASEESLTRLLSFFPDVQAERAARTIVSQRNKAEVETPLVNLYEFQQRLQIPDPIWRGEDSNRNDVLDAWENDGAISPPIDNQNNKLDRGIMDFLTIYGDETKNINTLEEIVLLSMPAVIDSIAAAILRRRNSQPFSSVQEIKDLPEVDEKTFARIAKWATVQTHVFKIFITAYCQNPKMAQHVHAIVDRSTTPARILYWQED